MAHSPTSTVDQEPAPRWLTVTPAIELGVLAVAVAVAVASYLLLSREVELDQLIAPGLIAALLVANIIPGVALMVLVGRRIARRRAARSPVGGEGRLHVRLLALFSTMAAVPMLLVAIAASLLFQYGVQFWSSERARSVFENATVLTQQSYRSMLSRWEEATATMAGDLSSTLSEVPIESLAFRDYFARQVYYRSLSEGVLFTISPTSGVQTLALVNPYEIEVGRQITPAIVQRLQRQGRNVVVVTGDRVQTFTRLPGTDQLFLYAAKVVENPSEIAEQTERAVSTQADYRALLTRARALQLRFNAALLAISFLIVGVAVWIALKVADRLVAPVGELVDAARRVEGGDLSVRVTAQRTRDEVGTLASAFNQMTGRLQQQNTALVTANDQLESRRALIEAVMSGVSAGVVSTDADGLIRIANRSAASLLGAGEQGLVGRSLDAVAPELSRLVREQAREEVVEVANGGEPRTLAVRIARADAGPILTFDDMTQQLADQRRAAWSDVARRIAHEIKNPLTPIQLAAERLQRRYGKTVATDDTTFARLTETIVRQVGDLRRMVDEFSSFARMPKPQFREEALVDIVRQAVFLYEVAHPSLRFTLEHDEPAPALVCDRRQLGQAMTNLVKNAVEAIEAAGRREGNVAVRLSGHADRTVVVAVADDGVGLPPDRDRIVEPYVTTRARGTGLGLAIVKKIVEEHCGTIRFADRENGGAVVSVVFDAAALRAMVAPDTQGELADTVSALSLTNRT